MTGRADIVICGSGQFAARILFDLAATTPEPLRIALIGRDENRLAWLRTGAQARAAMFGGGVRVETQALAEFSVGAMTELLAKLEPRLVANTASIQGGRSMTDRPDPWTSLTRRAGLGVAAVLQAAISLDVAAAVAAAAPPASFVNGCYPDVVNPMIAAAGLPVACGIGNVAILAHAFAGELGPGHGPLRMLAQHAALSAFRRPAGERGGAAPLRLWIDDDEVDDVFGRFAAVKLAPEPVVDVSGASAAPLFRAMALGLDWSGHAPGPNGLPGGYPVRLRQDRLRLDLPAGLGEAEAVEWNAAFEKRDGVAVGPGGSVRYAGKVEAALRSVSPDLAAGFRMADFEAVRQAVLDLRERLRGSG